MTLPVSLAAAAETLRACTCDNEKAVMGLIWRCSVHGSKQPPRPRLAVADLIDGMTRRHFPKQVSNWTIEHEQHHDPSTAAEFEPCLESCVETATICNACGTTECRELPVLVPLVRAFLPDWNPDTEETP